MKFVIATHNMKKRDELRRILSPLGIDAVLAEEMGLELSDVDEAGVTFEENALLKAESGCRETGLPCVADDSGLCVDALGGAPGVYSARYAGEHGNDPKNIEKLLFEMRDVPCDKRTARFVCAACCAFPDGRAVTVRGTCEGEIALEPKGTGGFGYDPVFVPRMGGGRTMAELSAQDKDAISHRRKALEALASELG
ncbi:MAG: RdgB/HAM1 family non-canonical purine NTP pyrophosphatase [Oscillospiraceae bacterium]|nr:RdgB/HAM1 family non-canonical purine NTP pyrophosphatase [Oscillospiraceae bacterium]